MQNRYKTFFVVFSLVFAVFLLGSAWAQKPEKKGNAGTETIKLIQAILKESGFEPGKVDGKFGWRTKKALRKFQKLHKIRGRGRLNRKTLAALLAEDEKRKKSNKPQKKEEHTKGE